MNDAIIVALLSLLGTAIGSVTSIFASMKVVNVKLENLQKEVAKHNQVVERTYMLEQRVAVLDVQTAESERRIVVLEKKAGELNA